MQKIWLNGHSCTKILYNVIRYTGNAVLAGYLNFQTMCNPSNFIMQVQITFDMNNDMHICRMQKKINDQSFTKKYNSEALVYTTLVFIIFKHCQ